MSFSLSPFAAAGPKGPREQVRRDLAQRSARLDEPLTSLLTPSAAQVVAVWGSLLELLDGLSHGHVGSRLLRLPLVAGGQVEGLRHGGAGQSLCLESGRAETLVEI